MQDCGPPIDVGYVPSNLLERIERKKKAREGRGRGRCPSPAEIITIFEDEGKNE